MTKIVDHVGPHGATADAVRGSLIASSLQSLRELGLYDRYLEHLPEEHHEAVLFCLAASWLPMETAAIHYAACDAMDLSEAEMTGVGEAVSKRMMGTFLGTMLRSARSLGGPTPWVPLKAYGRVCERVFRGGHHQVEEVGPKDAIVETSGVPLYRYRYFRTAFLGIVRGGAGVFAKTCYVKALRPTRLDAARVSLRWV